MELVGSVLEVDAFFAVTLGIIVLFVGKRLNQDSDFLRTYSIPEAVSGGLLFSLLFAAIYFVFGIEVSFDLAARDILLVYFFVTIGLNASFADLKAGGRPLAILLALTIGYMVVQNLTGITVAALFDLPAAFGLLGGTVSLIGGHGTAIAWAPQIAERFNIPNAMEIGIAAATFGLILASLMGGPIGKYLITSNGLKANEAEALDMGLKPEEQERPSDRIDAYSFLDAILAIHICGIVGLILNDIVEAFGLKLPLFVTCLFAAILITNLLPKDHKSRLTGRKWPARTPSVALLADVSLGTFLAMSLMSMQLWTLIDLAGPLFAILGAQFIVAIAVNLFLVFPLMGRNYDAAVISAGFGGISLGATPTAMANMGAVAQRYGPSHLAFIVVPLVCAFFIDLANAVMIPFFLNNF